ncbi:MAG: TonB-dependent receptor domain-containing protein, partial [Cyclobacteriaceae bacterium]
ASYSVANREPIRSDFINNITTTAPKPETLRNLEAGWRLRKNAWNLTVNYFLMDYTDQLVNTGKLNDVGAAIRTNVANSYRTGIEVDATVRFNHLISWMGNITLSQNKIKSFSEVLYDYGVNFDQYNEVVRSYTNSDIAFSPNVVGGSVLLFHPIRNVEIGLLTKYVGQQYLDNTSNSRRKIDAYLTNDIRLNYSWKPAFMKEFSISLLANNIFDVEYSSNGYTYGFLGGGAETRQNYYYPQAGRNYMLMLTLRF